MQDLSVDALKERLEKLNKALAKVDIIIEKGEAEHKKAQAEAQDKQQKADEAQKAFCVASSVEEAKEAKQKADILESEAKIAQAKALAVYKANGLTKVKISRARAEKEELNMYLEKKTAKVPEPEPVSEAEFVLLSESFSSFSGEEGEEDEEEQKGETKKRPGRPKKSLSSKYMEEADPNVILQTFLDIDDRHEVSYITVVPVEGDSRKWGWTCMCQVNQTVPFKWRNRAGMLKHSQTNCHRDFLKNPDSCIFNPGKIWTNHNLDLAQLSLAGLNNQTAKCGYCNNLEFPSTIDAMKEHINNLEHQKNVAAAATAAAAAASAVVSAGAAAVEIQNFHFGAPPRKNGINKKRSRDSSMELNSAEQEQTSVDKHIIRRMHKLIDEGRMDKKLEAAMNRKIESNSLLFDSAIERKLAKRCDEIFNVEYFQREEGG